MLKKMLMAAAAGVVMLGAPACGGAAEDAESRNTTAIEKATESGRPLPNKEREMLEDQAAPGAAGQPAQ